MATTLSTNTATIPDEIFGLSRGARFFRADLHIHSLAGSHDVKDANATPQAIVTLAAQEGLSIIAIADHNEIAGVATALEVAKETGIMVVPAIELSTPQGHLLCYFPTLGALTKFHGRLEIVDQGTPTSRCQNSILDCLTKVQELGGFGILAHVDAHGGFEVQNPGASPHKLDVLCHRALLGIELKGAASTISYAESDSESARSCIGKERIKRLNLGSRQFLARVLNSDAHTLSALGRNASGDRKVTRYKMQALTFDSLRIALEDSDARVRIEDEIPLATPCVRGISLAGGFLDGQAVNFSPNLNCIIGGRGTGKSTIFEAIRCLAGQSGGTNVIDSDVWPNEIDVFFEDQAGQVHHLVRPKDGDVENVNPVTGAVGFSVECYGQGETQKISQRAQNDPVVLIEYLDRFIDVREELGEEERLRKTLLDLQSLIEEAIRKVELIPQYERDLANTRSQLQALEQAKAKDIIALQRRIEEERQIRTQIQEFTKQISDGVSRQDLKTSAAALRDTADPASLAVGRTEFVAIDAQAQAFESALTSVESSLKTGATKLSAVVREQLAAWRAKELDVIKKVEEKKRALETQNIRVDLAYIQKLAADEAKLNQTLTNLKAWKPQLQKLHKQRRTCLKERWGVRDKIAGKRSASATRATGNLRDALSDLNITLRFYANSHSPEANTIILEVMKWRTQQVPRASLLTEKLTVPKLLEAIDQRDITPILDLSTGQEATFDKQEAHTILERLSEQTVRFRLERCEVLDLPKLTVTKPITDSAGKQVFRSRDFSCLSLGQQQSILLALMLCADSNRPLIIDQPEDNLDSEFIYKSLVPVLRRAKERRQVIIVTHNANIAVLGDAEQILVLRSTNERGMIISRGSIDEPGTRQEACAILEGAPEAFQSRSRIYGI